MPDIAESRRFLLFLIKPSHYDDDGYVIQWRRSALPSNSLACLYGIARDAAGTGALGPDRDAEIFAIDETNTRVRAADIARQIAAAGGRGLVCFVGVQSNSVSARHGRRPPAARGRRAGLHRRLPRLGLPRDAAGDARFAERGARPRGLALRRGGRRALRDFSATPPRTAETDLQLSRRSPRPARRRTPFLPKEKVGRSIGMISTFDAGRGCPFQCSFCTIINVQGRKSRLRTADDSSESCAPITRKASASSSSPTTISPATAIGRPSSTA